MPALLGALCAAGALSPAAARAGFAILSESVEVDPVSRQATFTLAFSLPPDFNALDEFGRPARSFQYEINPDWSGSVHDPDALFPIRTVIRGDEVRADGTLRVRNAEGEPDTDPIAGGWGPVRGSVPFQLDLDSRTLRFTASLDLLKDTDGVFAYRVFTTEFGETSSLLEAFAIPIPSAAAAGAIGLAGLAAARIRRRAPTKRARS